MRHLLAGLNRLLQWAVTALFAVLIVPVAMQILSRYTSLIPRYIWTEEIARFCFIWVIMLGAMIAVRDETHFNVDLFRPARTRAGKGWSQLLVHFAMLAFALCFVWYGRQFAEEGMMQTSEIADLPMIAIYAAWPLSGLVWALFLAEKLVEDVALIRGGALPVAGTIHGDDGGRAARAAVHE
ncbi:MAG: TRAP transporter small permease [Lautropia sp.]